MFGKLLEEEAALDSFELDNLSTLNQSYQYTSFPVQRHGRLTPPPAYCQLNTPTAVTSASLPSSLLSLSSSLDFLHAPSDPVPYLDADMSLDAIHVTPMGDTGDWSAEVSAFLKSNPDEPRVCGSVSPAPSGGMAGPSPPSTPSLIASRAPSRASSIAACVPDLTSMETSPQQSYLSMYRAAPADDLQLVTATLKADVTGSMTPLVKEEIRYKIQKKRRESGKCELNVEWKAPEPEKLTSRDEDRRSRRRASNRRAANKCRIKKRLAQETVKSENDNLVSENTALKKEIEDLEGNYAQLVKFLRTHSAECSLLRDGSIPPHAFVL